MRSLLALSLVALLAPNAAAWGPVGHMAVGMIAEGRLSRKTQAKVRELLGETTLDQIANCADGFGYGRQRDCAGTFQIPGDFEESRPWHYLDIDVELPDAGDPMSHCPPRGCAIPAIRKAMAELSDPKTSRHEKQVALMWLTHFVGDIHQPLHCAEHHHDEGGNKKPIDVEYGTTRDGKPKRLNLHSAWDHAIDPPYAVSFGEPHDKLVRAARALADKLSIESMGEDASASLAAPDLIDTAVLESWRIAKDKIYPRYAENKGKVADAVRTGYNAAYTREMQPIAYRRVKMAGWRLAALLERSLGRLP